MSSSYLNNRSKFVTINTERSSNTLVTHGAQSNHRRTVRHFADDTNLLTVSKSFKKINRKVNYNLRLTNDWLKANKLCLNPSKTKIIIFKAKRKIITKHRNFK